MAEQHTGENLFIDNLQWRELPSSAQSEEVLILELIKVIVKLCSPREYFHF